MHTTRPGHPPARSRWLWRLGLVTLLIACDRENSSTRDPSERGPRGADAPNPSAPQEDAGTDYERPALCERSADDAVRDIFNVALSRMTRAELDVAIARIQLPADSEQVMPPKGMRQLDEAGKQRLLEYLRANVRSAEDDEQLEHAAREGMARPKYAYIGI